MLKFALLLVLPCLIVAETCSGGEVSCSEGKTCCTVDGKPACCDADLEATLPLRSTLLTAPNNITVQDAFTRCTMFTCTGTCCSDSYNGCCPLRMGTCCTASTCCNAGAPCCGGGCCPLMSRCCGSWCCKSRQRCGLSYMTCFNAAALLSPTTLVTLLAMWFAIYVVAKL